MTGRAATAEDKDQSGGRCRRQDVRVVVTISEEEEEGRAGMKCVLMTEGKINI